MVSSAFGPLPQNDIRGDAYTLESHPCAACRRNSPNLFQQFCPLPRNTGSRCASGASFIRGRCHRALSPYQNAPLLPQSETLEI